MYKKLFLLSMLCASTVNAMQTQPIFEEKKESAQEKNKKFLDTQKRLQRVKSIKSVIVVKGVSTPSQPQQKQNAQNSSQK